MQTRAAPESAESNATPAKRPGLRESMPQCAAFIDEMRAAFGAEEINAQIKLGMQGAQTFHAVENGHEVGTCFDVPVKFITADKMAIRPTLPDPANTFANFAGNGKTSRP